MVSLGNVRFAPSGKAALGTMFGVVFLFLLFLRKSCGSSDINVVNVT